MGGEKAKRDAEERERRMGGIGEEGGREKGEEKETREGGDGEEEEFGTQRCR